MCGPIRDGTTEPVSRDQILRRERGQRNNIYFPCSADHYIAGLATIPAYSFESVDHAYIRAEPDLNYQPSPPPQKRE